MKKILIAAGLIIFIGVLIITMTPLKYAFYFFPGITYDRVVLTLPFFEENMPDGMMQMGEKMEHPFGMGHPGIDFGWNRSVPLIASADGKISYIKKVKAGENNKELEDFYSIEIVHGHYVTRYTEMQDYNRTLKPGMKIKRGSVVGYPNCQIKDDNREHCMIHWEFASLLAKAFPWKERLCPMTYFDEKSRVTIQRIFDEMPANEMKEKYPEICSGAFKGRD